MKFTRRNFLRTMSVGVIAGSITSGLSNCSRSESLPSSPDLKLGMASYSFRQFSLDEAIQMTNRLGLKHIALKSMHLPYDLSESDLGAAAAKVRNAGLNLYGGGVIYMREEEEVHQAFDYARAAGFQVIIGAPAPELLDLVDQKVKEYDIKLAIHNHGPGDEQYPSPESVYTKVQDLDPRIGLCIDIGHTQRIGLQPAEHARKYADRLHDIHIKDVDAPTAEGTTVEIGRGVIDIPEFLSTLREIKYQGIVSLEYEKDANDPLPGAAESIGYLRGVMSVI